MDKANPAIDAVSTRGKRRKLVGVMIGQLQQIRTAEESYLNSFPENLQGSYRYEEAGESISLMEEAIELLSEIYG